MRGKSATEASHAQAPWAELDQGPDPGRQSVPRPVYVAMRLEEIATTVGVMAKERERLTVDLKSSSLASGVTQKQLRQRRAYIAMRLAILRREQAALKIEKTQLAAAGANRVEVQPTAAAPATTRPTACPGPAPGHGQVAHGERPPSDDPRS
jgi:hypothetical protein